MSDTPTERSAIYLPSGEGRSYDMGPLQAIFKADGAEGDGKYSVSEWWLEPHTAGPGVHSHAEDDLFYVVEGTVSFLMLDKWIDADKGAFVLVPGGMTHDFENRSDQRAGLLNFSSPGNFEQNMPAIAQWFQENPPGTA